MVVFQVDGEVCGMRMPTRVTRIHENSQASINWHAQPHGNASLNSRIQQLTEHDDNSCANSRLERVHEELGKQSF